MSTRANTNLAKEFTDAMRIELDIQKDEFQKIMDSFSQKIVNLEKVVTEKDARIAELELKVDNLATEVDSLESYGRRMNFRIENVEMKEGETPASLQNSIIAIVRESGVNLSPDDIVRHHRSSRVKEKEVDDGGRKRKLKYGQCIIKLSSWRMREAVHNARKKSREIGHPTRQDLTKIRYELIAKARRSIDRWGVLDQPVYAYANINLEPTIRRGAAAMKFRSDRELDEALANFAPK